jgi:hypothetical protein
VAALNPRIPATLTCFTKLEERQKRKREFH